MARRQRVVAEGGSDDDVNLTPMLDVVFILLIFFIVTAQFIREPGIDIDRQDVDNLSKQNPLGILVAIDEDNEIWMAKEQVSMQEIGFKLREAREDNPKGKLVVQVDKDSDAGILIELIEIINKEDGLTQIPISTVEG
ncbi:MAG: biopolymer transporter ExbD [Pseudomonadota bacterium]